MNVLMVDDEPVVLTVSRAALSDIAETVVTLTSARDALDLDLESFDIILSDFYMPGMQGDEFLAAVRARLLDIPFIFLTQNEDLSVAVELMRQGADDYVSKPIDPTTLVFRIQKTIHEKEQQRQIRRILEEQRLLDMENRKLANWRLLYASKDARQTELLVNNLSRNVNQAGGFLWVQLLGDSLGESDDDHYRISKAVVDMALNAARNQETLFNQVTYIGSLETMSLEMQDLDAVGFHGALESLLGQKVLPILQAHERPLRWNSTPPAIPGPRSVQVDMEKLSEIMQELAVNAIKFSPPGTPVTFDLCYQTEGQMELFVIQVSNVARRLQAMDETGNPVHGIPYDYMELVFELFFSIEAFPEYLPEEQWTDGSGLYIARKLLRLMNGWIAAHSGIDYTAESPRPVVRMDVRLPAVRSEDAGAGH